MVHEGSVTARFPGEAEFQQGRVFLDMAICPGCQGHDIRPSHRRGFLERDLLTWVRVFPFRCCQCRARFYRFVPESGWRVAYGAEGSVSAGRPRDFRWPIYEEAVVTVSPPGQASVILRGLAVNASLAGVRLQLPIALEEDSLVSVALNAGPPRRGIVRWARSHGESGFLHGVRFDAPADRRGTLCSPYRRLRIRMALRRGLILLVSAVSIAVAAYGLVWLIEAVRMYNPKYYEPKDIERERHELQRELEELKRPQRS